MAKNTLAGVPTDTGMQSQALDVSAEQDGRHARQLEQLFCSTLGAPFFSGNAISTLRNGAEIFPAMLAAIRAARHTVEFLTFVYWKGDVAEQFARALAERAEAGVRVHVLLDGYGAYTMPKALVRQMEDAGCDVRWFRPLSSWKVWRFDNRTHRKLMICDGEIAFTGGVGIAAEWEGRAQDPDHWRDNHFRVKGPAVAGLRAGFLSNWAEAKGPLDRVLPHAAKADGAGGADADEDAQADVRQTNACMPAIEPAGEAKMLVVRSVASASWSDVAMMMRTAVSAATQRLWFTTAYFLPDERLLAQLCAAARRGVDVRIMIPGRHTDQRLAQFASQAVYQSLIDAGAELLVYQRTMLHRKSLVLDDTVSIIGSANVNARSLNKDDELSCVVIDAGLNAELAADFEADQADCEAIDLQRWSRRAAWKTRAQQIVRRVIGHEI